MIPDWADAIEGPAPISPAYIYRARVRRVVDADTIDFDFDLGMHHWIIAGRTDSPGRVRLYGINAWETRGAEREKGIVATRAAERYLRWVEGQLPVVIVETIRDRTGKYGRYLAVVWVPGKPVSLNQWLVEEGHAEWHNYD